MLCNELPCLQPDPDNHVITVPILGSRSDMLIRGQVGLKPPSKRRSVLVWSLLLVRSIQGEIGGCQNPPPQQCVFAPFPLFYSWESCSSLAVCGLKIEGKMGIWGRLHGGGRWRVWGLLVQLGFAGIVPQGGVGRLGWGEIRGQGY